MGVENSLPVLRWTAWSSGKAASTLRSRRRNS